MLAEGARFCGEAVSTLASMAAQEMLERIMEEGLRPIQVHCVGHSMGGLIIRGALPEILEKLVSVDQDHLVSFGHYLSLSTPHLGIQASWSAPSQLWRNLAWFTSFVSAQVVQLSVQDSGGEATGSGCEGSGAGDVPYLVRLSRRNGRAIRAMRVFRTRTCVTLTSGDSLIPFASGIINSKRVDEGSTYGYFDDASWNFGVRSGTDSDGLFERRWQTILEKPNIANQESENAPRGYVGVDSLKDEHFESSAPNACPDLEWITSEDGTCCFPKEIILGLCSVPWQRIAVEMRHPPFAKSGHVFLIGKKAEQFEVEHQMSRECIECLIELLADSGSGT
eukprot:TRINITY_DN13710_c0_g1_i1.p1 TRINITY_DN13710_c0_g1~~TRINITY_DN13710_c0_g1_i1.p1  ORF type:complete len:336 (-),score=32.60 TRINITY_DN13710_c0_g1_i1:511-1518(-)